MVPRCRDLLALVGCGVLCASGCAVEQFEDDAQTSGTGAQPVSGGAAVVGGSTSGASTGGRSAAGGSNLAGTTSQAGAPAAGGASGASGASAGTGGVGGSPKPVNTNLPFSEDFEDGAANGFIPWNQDMMPGAWAVVADGGGKIYQPQSNVAELEFAVGGSSSWNDVALTVKVRLKDANSGAQVALRFTAPKTYLVVEMAVGKYKLRARTEGSTTDLVSPSPKPTLTPGTWYTVGLTVKGSTATLTLDGMTIGAPAMVPSGISNGGIALGVAEGSVAFDDVRVVAAP